MEDGASYHTIKIMVARHTKGFSLIELLIAVSIFLIITVAAIGSMIHLQGAAQKGEASYATLDNLNLTMDSMTRLVRTGTNFHCGLSGDLAAPADCPYRGNVADGQPAFAFTSQSGKRIQFQLSSTSVEMKEDPGAWFRITDDSIIVDRFRIYVEGSTQDDTKQPYALLVVSGKIMLGSQSSDFHLQTTMTQRLPDGNLSSGGEEEGGGDTEDPTVPTGLNGDAVSSSQIDLSWSPSTDNSGVVTGYKIYRDSIQVGTAPGTSFSDTGLTASKEYAYTVAAFDATGNTSPYSTAINITTRAGADTTAPSTPTGLSATAVPGQITLNWTASTDTGGSGMSNYRIERCTPAACTTFVQIATPANAPYVDTTGLTPGVTHRYRIRAEDNAGNLSAPSAIVSVVAQAATVTMGETAVLATADSGNGNRLVSYSTTLSQNGTLQSLSFYVTTVAGNLRLGVFDDNGPGGGPGTKLAETASFAPVAGWNTRAVITPVSLTAGTYWLAYLPSSSTLGFRMVTTGTAKYYTYTFGPMPATFSTTPTTGTFHWSFYATLNAN